MMLDFGEDPVNTPFGGSSGIRVDTIIVGPGSRMISLAALHRPMSQVCWMNSLGDFDRDEFKRRGNSFLQLCCGSRLLLRCC